MLDALIGIVTMAGCFLAVGLFLGYLFARGPRHNWP